MSSKLTAYPRHNLLKGKTKKPQESGGFYWDFDRSQAGAAGLEPLRAALATMVPARPAVPVITTAPIAVIAVRAAHEPVVPPASATEPAFHMRQDGEATLLAVVERLVERISRVRDPLHRCRRGRHGVGAVAQPRHRIVRLLLVLRIPLRIHPRVG